MKIITQTKRIEVEILTVTCKLWLNCLTNLKNLGSSFTIKCQSLQNKTDKWVVTCKRRLEDDSERLKLCKETKKKFRE